MKYNLYNIAAAVDAGRKTELRDVSEIMGALLFTLCAMASAVALL